MELKKSPADGSGLCQPVTETLNDNTLSTNEKKVNTVQRYAGKIPTEAFNDLFWKLHGLRNGNASLTIYTKDGKYSGYSTCCKTKADCNE